MLSCMSTLPDLQTMPSSRLRSTVPREVLGSPQMPRVGRAVGGPP